MEFDESRVYTALNADELKVGSKVVLADSIAELKRRVQSNVFETLKGVNDESFLSRFRNKEEDADYSLAYLVEPPEEKILKWIDLKVGDVIKNKDNGALRLVIGIDKDDSYSHIIADSYISDEDLEDWEKVENDTK